MRAYGVTALRLAVAVVFIWFGVLKIIDRGPVADLAADTVYWLPAGPFVRFLGLSEVVVGMGLLLRGALRATLLLFWMQMAGTLLVFAFRHDVAFQSGNPLLLTITGEFVVKNLVLIAAGLVIGSTVGRDREGVAGPSAG
jgi:uncharacterized membrane protein YkgB